MSIIIGETWDESYYYEIGKIVFNYIFSIGKINKELFYREFYSASIWSTQYFISIFFPIKYKIEIIHILNSILALTAVYGVKKVSKILFNNNVSNYAFILLLLLPIYFGHMPINSKDTFLAGCHVWIFYYLLKYLNFNQIKRPIKLNIKIGTLFAIGTGIQIIFIGSLLPLFLFFFFDAFIFKKILNSKIKIRYLAKDVIIAFLVFYIVLALFWVDIHSNIFTKPFLIFFKMFSENFYTGWPYNNLNGNYFLSSLVSFDYFWTLVLFKFPEYIILLTIIFTYFFFFKNNILCQIYKNFNYKLIIFIFLSFYPSIIVLFIPFPVYDGLRLFLWCMPYLMIPAAVVFDYIIINKKKFMMLLTIISFSFLFYLYEFFTITPYQYTYLNFFAGNESNKYNAFENDYWAASLKELIKKINIDKSKSIKISTCGVPVHLVKKFLMKEKYLNLILSTPEVSEYVIMTNRTTLDFNGNITNCYNLFKGVDKFYVKKNGLILSTIRKVN